MPLRALLSLGLLAALLAVPLGAEEPAAAADAPAARTARLLAALPAPDAGQAWSYEGEMIVNGSPIGTMSFSMEVAAHEGRPAWKGVDELRVGTANEGVHVRTEALLDPQLGTLSGTTVARMTGEPDVELTWRREGTAYRIRRREGETVVEATLDGAAPRLAGTAAQVHLMRALPAEPGTYAWQELQVDAHLGPEPAKRLASILAKVLEPAPFEVHPERPMAARVNVSAPGDDRRTTTVSLAVEGRALLGLEQPGARLVVRRRPASAPDDASGPATTAKAAALRAARALATGDAQALGKVLNWATVDARLAKDDAFAGLEPAARRARLLERLDERLRESPPEMIEMVLRQVEGSLVVDDLGEDRARVTFPAIFRNLKLVVAKVGDAWLLDDLPGAP